jgi:hypothetical protein
MTNEAGMNGDAGRSSPPIKFSPPGAAPLGGANLRTCNLRPLKVGGLRRPITRVGKILETEEGAMNGIILFAAPAVAALGALASLGLFVQALNAAKTNHARVRVPVRRARRR